MSYAATPIAPADALAEMEGRVLGLLQCAKGPLSREAIDRALEVKRVPELESIDLVGLALERLETDLGRIERLPARNAWQIIGRRKRRRLR